MRYRIAVPLLMIVLTNAACGQGSSGGTPSAGAGPDDGFAAAGLIATCGGNRFDRLPPDTSTFTPFTNWDNLDLEGIGGEGAFFDEFVGGFDWYRTDETATTRSLFGVPRPGTDRRPGFAAMSLELRDGRWKPLGFGDCAIQLEADGYGNASFRVDPERLPGPDATRVAVLATERACAGGAPPTDRDVRAVVVDEGERSVAVVILVEPVSGGATCPSNPDFSFEVELPSALGDREIVDASAYPFEVRWPG